MRFFLLKAGKDTDSGCDNEAPFVLDYCGGLSLFENVARPLFPWQEIEVVMPPQ
jgi:hypothetical protein